MTAFFARPSSYVGLLSDPNPLGVILLVEDEPLVRLVAADILTDAHFRVIEAADAQEALTVLKAEIGVDVVVSDVEMPRLNGFELTARLRAERRLTELPVVLVTALDSREDRERGIEAGANAYLVKSDLDQSNLLDALRRLT